MFRRTLVLPVLAVTAGLAVGCSSSGSEAAETPATGQTSSGDSQAGMKPVTLTMYTLQNFTDDSFRDLIAEPLKKKYPYITVEWIRSGTGGSSLADLLGGGTVPDLVNGWNGELATYAKYHLLGDMTPWIQKERIDLNRFQPVVIDAVRKMSDKGEIYAVPYSLQLNALYYNKDIFDKFGVGYPKDGMTWEDAIELGKSLSRKDGDTAYRGLDYEHISRLSFPLSPDIVDARTNRANVDNDVWRKVFELGKSIVSIPGNVPAKIDSGSTDAFFKDKNVAMYASVNWFDRARDAVAGGLNLGVAQYPSFKGQPNTYGMVDAHYIAVTDQCKDKDAAMKVVETLVSDEVQLAAARKYAKQSPLQNPEMKQQFAADMPELKGVNLQSIFKSKPAPGVNFSLYYGDARKILMKEYVNYAGGKEDLNTALRNATEVINKMIDADQGK